MGFCIFGIVYFTVKYVRERNSKTQIPDNDDFEEEEDLNNYKMSK